MPQLSDDPKKRAGEEKCLADVAEHGLHVLRIFGDAEWPAFAYSVGLFQNFQIPEIIIVGLDPDLSHIILNALATRARGGERFQVGDMLEGLIDGFPVVLRSVRDEMIEPHFGWDLWFYDRQEFPTAQLVWPTTSGTWPWDANASDEFRALQPLLDSAPMPDWARNSGQ
ncbi:MAG TPA: DUF4262 domain-containing protein [Gemmatimonadaceae bacterium]